MRCPNCKGKEARFLGFLMNPHPRAVLKCPRCGRVWVAHSLKAIKPLAHERTRARKVGYSGVLAPVYVHPEGGEGGNDQAYPGGEMRNELL
jgi:hypothetical protein